MVSLLVLACYSVLSPTDCTQKVPLFDLEIPTRYSVDFFCVIHEIYVALIQEVGCQGNLASTRKPERI